MSNYMKFIAENCLPKAMQVTDRFHVQKLTIEALQNIHIKYIWEAIDIENKHINLTQNR